MTEHDRTVLLAKLDDIQKEVVKLRRITKRDTAYAVATWATSLEVRAKAFRQMAQQID